MVKRRHNEDDNNAIASLRQYGFQYTAVEDRAYMSNYIPLFNMGIMTNPCPNPEAL